MMEPLGQDQDQGRVRGRAGSSGCWQQRLGARGWRLCGPPTWTKMKIETEHPRLRLRWEAVVKAMAWCCWTLKPKRWVQVRLQVQVQVQAGGSGGPPTGAGTAALMRLRLRRWWARATDRLAPLVRSLRLFRRCDKYVF